MVKILLILVFVPVLLKTLVLLIKRFRLHCRIKKACKNVGTQFKSLSPWFKSIFWERGKADYLIGGKIKLSVLTLPYRNARYHFVPDEKKGRCRFGTKANVSYKQKCSERSGEHYQCF